MGQVAYEYDIYIQYLSETIVIYFGEDYQRQ